MITHRSDPHAANAPVAQSASTVTEACFPDAIYCDLYRYIANCQGAASGDSQGFSWTDSPYPVWGRVCFGLDLALSPEAVLPALREKLMSLNCLLATGPSSVPANAEVLLENAGFTCIKRGTGMVLDRHNFKPATSAGGLSIREVESDTERFAWASCVCRNLFEKTDPQDAKDFADIAQKITQGGRFRPFAGFDAGGFLVATSAAFSGRCGTDGVFFVTVEPSARRRGFGGLLTAAATQVCLDAGASRATLMATPAGRPVYEALGYKAVSAPGRYGPPRNR